MSAKKLLVVLVLLCPIVWGASVEEWTQYVESLSPFVFPHRKECVQIARNILAQSDITLNPECRHHVKMFADRLDNFTLDAMRMFDSFSNPKPGIESNLVYDMGHYETCEKTLLDGHPAKFHLIKVKFTLPSTTEIVELYDQSFVNASWPLSTAKRFIPSKLLPLLFGVCIPSTCGISDLNSIVNSKYVSENFTVKFEIHTPRYTEQNSRYALAKSISKWAIFAIIFANVFSTVFNVGPHRLVGHFNIRRNWEVLARPPFNPSTQFMAEWKVFYCLFSTVSHLFIPISGEVYYQMGIPLYEAMETSPLTRLIMSIFPTIVGSNFIITASLSVFMWSLHKKDRKINFVQFVLVRAFRSLPMILVMIFFTILLPDMGLPGPQMNLWATNVSGNCFENGLSELLFTSNFVSVPVMCSRTGWFVSADMQLYVASFLLVMFLCNNRIPYKKHKQILRYLIVASTVSTYVFCYYFVDETKDLLSTRSEYLMDDPWRIVGMYLNTYQYVLPYLVGLYLGYEMSKGTQWSRGKASFVGKASLVISPICLIAPYSLDLPSYSKAMFALVYTIQKIIFPISTAAFFYSLWSYQDLKKTKVTIVGYFSAFMARLIFPWFLIHPMVISYLVIWLGFTYTSLMQIITVILPGEIVLTFILSIVFHLTVELPFAFLFGALVNKKPSEGIFKVDSKVTGCDKDE